MHDQKEGQSDPIGSKLLEAFQVQGTKHREKVRKRNKSSALGRAKRNLPGRIISTVQSGRAVNPSRVEVASNTHGTSFAKERLESSGRGTTLAKSTTTDSGVNQATKPDRGVLLSDRNQV
jgi:hypothetical protein